MEERETEKTEPLLKIHPVFSFIVSQRTLKKCKKAQLQVIDFVSQLCALMMSALLKQLFST